MKKKPAKKTHAGSTLPRKKKAVAGRVAQSTQASTPKTKEELPPFPWSDISAEDREKIEKALARESNLRKITEQPVTDFDGLSCDNEDPESIVRAFLLWRAIHAAQNEPGDRDENLTRALCRYCATFPEAKAELHKYDVARAYALGDAKMMRLPAWAEAHPLANVDTLRFLLAYLPSDSDLRKCSLSECAKRMGWLTESKIGDHKRIENILQKIGIKHGKIGKPGRPRKIP